VLRDAVGRGQLGLAEVDERLRATYAARTRADLAAVTADLPQATPPRPPAPERPAVPTAARLPWLGVSALLLTIWALTSLAAGHPLFFWPVFPIGFWGLSVLRCTTGARTGGCRAVSTHRS
jgi:hypothetical protein